MGKIIEFGHSTGPRTAAGKRRSSRNATKLGLYSQAACIPGLEDPSAFEDLLRSIIAFHEIEDPVVLLAAERFISTAWRLRRARRVETERLGLQARAHAKASAALQTCRDELANIVRWKVAVLAIYEALHGGSADPATVDSAVGGIDYLVCTADFKAQGIDHALIFNSAGLSRIIDAGKDVKARTIRAAFDAARKDLPEGLARESLWQFIWDCIAALEQREAAARADAERAEIETINAFVAGSELNWQDARTLSDAERRLDGQFSRALRDLQEARREAAGASVNSRPGKEGPRRRLGNACVV